MQILSTAQFSEVLQTLFTSRVQLAIAFHQALVLILLLDCSFFFVQPGYISIDGCCVSRSKCINRDICVFHWPFITFLSFLA